MMLLVRMRMVCACGLVGVVDEMEMLVVIPSSLVDWMVPAVLLKCCHLLG